VVKKPEVTTGDVNALYRIENSGPGTIALLNALEVQKKKSDNFPALLGTAKSTSAAKRKEVADNLSSPAGAKLLPLPIKPALQPTSGEVTRLAEESTAGPATIVYLKELEKGPTKVDDTDDLIPILKKMHESRKDVPFVGLSAEEGFAGATKGWVPTLFGYGAQGFCKFGFNEFFKDFYGYMMGPDWSNGPTWKKMVLWAAASGSAEVFADVALCPFEMTKVKMQVTLPNDTTTKVPGSFGGAWKYMSENKIDTRFPFGSLVPLWGRQVPYTMIKFVGFYQTQDMVYNYLETSMKRKKSSFNEATQLAITFGCGYWAGIFCAIATQPMDNLVSMKGIPENKNKSWGAMSKEMGTVGLFTKGLGTRIIMIGTLTGLQWWIYGSFKSFMGFGTS